MNASTAVISIAVTMTKVSSSRPAALLLLIEQPHRTVTCFDCIVCVLK
jgi:hypothetical protein